MDHHHDMEVPRIALIGAGLLIVLTISLAGLSRAGIIAVPTANVAEEATAERDLYFRDRQQGGIEVLSAETGAVVTVFEPGTNGFARGVLRSLVRERHANGLDDEVPMRLVRFKDGRLALVDPVTNERIELVSFGPTNLGVFAKLLPSEGNKL